MGPISFKSGLLFGNSLGGGTNLRFLFRFDDLNE